MSESAPPGVNPNVPSAARMYDYFLGGVHNYAADREAARKILEVVPGTREIARANREFLGRTVRFLAERGLRQFLDIGAGLPTQENVHEVAQGVSVDCRTVYVDNDPIVLIHANRLLAGTPNTIAVEGDLREPASILGDPAVRSLIDFDRPVALLLLSVLHFVPDHDQAAAAVRTLRAPLVPGSHLLLSHFYSPDMTIDAVRTGREVYSTTSTGSLTARSFDQISGYFDGLDLLEPGLVPVHAWRSGEVPDLSVSGVLGAIGRVR